MSALVPEISALGRTPKERQQSGCEPGLILAQLSAALENQDIKALEWSTDGRGVLVHSELYEEEIWKKKELFPQLAELSSVVELHAWLLAFGFKLKGASVNSRVLLLQHPHFQKAYPNSKELGDLGGDASLSTKQKNKKKKSLQVPRGAQDRLGQRPRQRPLYQYINMDMMELMHPPAEDQEPELIQPSQVPAAPKGAAASQLQDVQASSTPKIPTPGVMDRSMELDIDGMLKHAAQLMPLLFPQYK